jgi:phage terminase small subunit
LTDPRDLKVFYVGKGTAARSYAHTHSLTKLDKEGDTPKSMRIKEILAAGEEVIVSIIKRFSDEEEAYAHETKLIEGLDGLLNATGGGGGGFSHQTKQKTKLTPKQNAFAMKYIECGSAADAYRHAYNCENMSDPVIRNEACDLLKNPVVTMMVKDLKSRAVARHNITVDGQAAKLEELLELAHQTAQPGAGVSAVTVQSKLFGLLVDKQQIDMTGSLAMKLKQAKQRANDGS